MTRCQLNGGADSVSEGRCLILDAVPLFIHTYIHLRNGMEAHYFILHSMLSWNSPPSLKGPSTIGHIFNSFHTVNIFSCKCTPLKELLG